MTAKHFTYIIAAASMSLAGNPSFANDDHERGTRIRFVNCAHPHATIQQTMDRIRHARPATIVIKGTCTEEVTVRRDDLTLLAHENGGTVDGSIYVAGAQRVTIDGLTVTGSSDGVGALDNASVTIRNATLENNRGSGVLAARSALVILYDNLIRLNDEYGVLVVDGANAQVRAGNTIESDVAAPFAGGPIGGYRHATIRIRDGGNVIKNNATLTPADPQDSSTATGMAIDVEHGSILRQDNGDATIVGHVYMFNLTSADFRDAHIDGHIFIDGLNANFRIRNSTVVGGMNMFGEATFRNNVEFTGDVYCHYNFLSMGFTHNGNRIECFS